MPAPLPRSRQEIQAAAKQYDLGPYRENFDELKLLKLEADIAARKYELFRNRLKDRVGDADELVIDGQVVATHAISGAFNQSRFAKEQSHIFQEFLVDRVVQVFDEEAFAATHPALHAGDAYRARSLRFKS